jgi:hypothetical protein
MERQNIFEFEVKKHLTKVYKDNCSFNPSTTSIEDGMPISDFFAYVNFGGNFCKLKWELDHVSNKEDDFEKNYGNKLTEVSSKKLSIFVKKTEEKLTLIYFLINRHRQVDKPYFKIGKVANFVTYNFATHDVYSGTLTNYHKKRKCVKTIKRNYFFCEPFKSFTNLFLHYAHDFILPDNKSASEIIAQALNTFKENIPGYNYSMHPIDLDTMCYLNYLKRRGIKYPNNWFIFRKMFPLATKKELKQNDSKLINIFMKRNELKGDRIRKILHQVKSYPNINVFKLATNLFGNDFIIQRPDDEIIDLFNVMDHNDGYYFNIDHLTNNFTKKEKSKIYKVFRNVFCDNQIHFNTFFDHINFYNKIKKYEPIVWKSEDTTSFNQEHLEWSEKVELYSQNKCVRIYDDEIIRLLETPIENENGIFQPKVLIRSGDYIEESSHQQHCVKTYSKTCNALIVSIRKETERGTLEFRINSTEEGYYTLKRVQTRGKYNNSLPESWNSALDKIDIITNQINRKKLFKTNEMDLCFFNNQTKRLKPTLTNLGNYSYLDWDEKIDDQRQQIDDLPMF